MKKFKQERIVTIFHLAIITFFGAASIFIFFRGIIIHPDSIGYLNGHIVRSPVYPLFLQFTKLIGGSYFHQLLILFQLIIGILATLIFSTFVRNAFKINKWYLFAISIFIFSPYLIGIKGANAMVTEAIAYPLFLISIKFVIESILTIKLNKFIWAFVTISILILTRSQFLFLYPLFFLLIGYLIIFEKRFRPVATKVSLLFITSIVLTFSIEMSYHFVAHCKFIRTPFTGIQLVTNVIYVSAANDSTFFESKEDRNLFNTIMQESEKKKVIQSTIREGEDYYAHYDTCYNKLCWQTIFPVLKANLKYENENQLYVNTDKITLAFSKILLLHNWKKFAKLYLSNIYYGTGGFTGFLWKMLFSIIAVLSVLFNKKNTMALVLLFIIALHWCNVFLISIVEPVMPRYTYYTDILLYVMISILCIIFFEYHNKLDSKAIFNSEDA